MKNVLLTLSGLVLTAAMTLSALAQGNVGFKNDSQHYYVLGTTAPGDAGLGGGSSSGFTGAIPASPLPSGFTLYAALYGGLNPNNLTLQDQVALNATGLISPGIMQTRGVVTSIPANSGTSYWTVVVADVISSDVSTTDLLSHYFGSSPEFTMEVGSSFTFPSITPGSPWNSTWGPGNVVINYIPEPSTLALAGLGAVAVMMRMRGRRDVTCKMKVLL